MTVAYFDPTPLREPGTINGRLAVWIDENLCTGDANCATNVPAVFTMNDGLAYVVGDEGYESGPGKMALIPEGEEQRSIDEADDCPGECIFIEVVGHNDITPEHISIGADR